MVGTDDQHRIAPEIVTVHQVKDAAQIAIAHGHQGTIAAANMFYRLRALLHLAARPVVVRPVPRIFIQREVFFGGVKRFMRIEGFDLQQPVILRMVFFDKLAAGSKDASLRKIGLFADIITIYPVLAPEPGHAAAGLFLRYAQHLRDNRIGNAPFPAIALLTAHDLPRVVTIMVITSAILPVMQMIADKVRIHARFFQQLRHGVVKRLQRPPFAMEEVVPPGV